LKFKSKSALNANAKSVLRTSLRAKSWVQKVESIARMNSMTKTARASMKRRLDKA